MNNHLKYLVYDIESITNKKLLNQVLFAGENLSDEEAYQAHLKELEQEGKTFINPSFHRPISLAAAAISNDYRLLKINLIGGDQGDTKEIVAQFWDIYNNHDPILVDFNGKGYDVRLLELWAFHLGISITKKHFQKFGARYKFNEENHIDLQDFLTNFNSIRLRGGLDLFSKLLGKPGKLSTKGEMVQDLYDQNQLQKINDYCMCDVIDTYFVFLRTRVMLGNINLDQEKRLVDEARLVIQKKYDEEGYLGEYLENFGEWNEKMFL